MDRILTSSGFPGVAYEPAIRCTLRVTKALSDLQRIRILMMLAHGELCVCRIVQVLGLAPSTVSKHLRILNEANLIVFRKEGRWAFYSLSRKDPPDFTSPLLNWLVLTLSEDNVMKEDLSVLNRTAPKIAL